MIYLLLFFVSFNLNALSLLDQYRAVQAYEKQDYLVAGQNFEKVLSQSPNDFKNLNNMGNILYKQGKFFDAASYFEQALKAPDILESEKKELLFNLASSYAQQEKWHEALKEYEELIKLTPDDLRVTKNIEIIKKLLEKQEQEKQNQQDQKQDQQKDQEQDQEQNQESGEQDQEKKSGNSDRQDRSQPSQQDQSSQPDKPEEQKKQNEKTEKKPGQGQQAQQPKPSQDLMQKLDDQQKAYLQAIEQSDQRANNHLMKMQQQQLKGQSDDSSKNNW